MSDVDLDEQDLVADVTQLKRKLERYAENDETHKILKALSGLQELEMSVYCLKKTGIGKVVNNLRKRDGEVGRVSHELISKWKSISVPSVYQQLAAPKRPNGAGPVSVKRPASPSAAPLLNESLAKLPCLDDDPDICSLLTGPAHLVSGAAFALPAAAAGSDVALNISSRKTRTSIFSGRARQRAFAHVPKLLDLCIRVLMDHINEIEEMGPVPYHVIKPVLEACTALQLRTLEHHNPHLTDDSDELWVKHCEKDFRLTELEEEDESYRDLYARKLNERESKLQKLTRTIKANTEARAAPVRQTKVAVLDPKNMRKGPRISVIAQTSSARAAVRSMAVPAAPARSRGWGGGGSSSGGSGAAPVKKAAPLMAKTLKDLKNRFR